MSKKLLVSLIGVAVVGAGLSANAWEAQPVAKAGDETKALASIVGNFTLKGNVKKDALAPGSPGGQTIGKRACKWVVDGLFVQCDIAETFGKGKDAGTWKGQVIAGWDPHEKAYRAVIVDNTGLVGLMNGTLEGKKQTWELVSGSMQVGETAAKWRMIVDATNPNMIQLTQERKDDKGNWVAGEESILKRSK